MNWVGNCVVNGGNLNISGNFNLLSNNITITGFTSPSVTPTDFTTINSYDSSGYLIDSSNNSISFVLQCQNPCLSCFVLVTNCTSCNTSTTTPYLFNNICLSACPQYYYNTSNGYCYSCAALGIRCSNCINSTTCSTNCDIGAVYLNGNCLATTPDGYVNISGIAQPCTNNCSTCSIIQSNCTSCLMSLFLYINLCVSNCPTGFIAINLICVSCKSPCFTCITTITNCLSCDPSIVPAVYLSGVQCTSTCPSTTYKNSFNNTCTVCTNPCLTCLDSVSCLSCISTYSLYQSNCLQSCISGYVSINNICVICFDPCMTCINTASNCTSCKSNLFLYDNQCVASQNCPTGTYGNTSNYQCTACVSPCASCISLLSC